jgi:hypothetical protein
MTTIPFTNWESVAQELTERTDRQCRERWLNYLSLQVRSGPWSAEEDAMLVAMLNAHGRSWSVIRRLFNGRSENDIKNRWYSHLQFETVAVGEQLLLARGSPCEVGRTERHKRRRTVCDPKGTALRLLERQLLPLPLIGSSPVCPDHEAGPAVQTEVADLAAAEVIWDCAEGGDEFSGWPTGGVEGFEVGGFWGSE